MLCNVSCNSDAKILLRGRKMRGFPSRLVSCVLFVGTRPKAIIFWADEASGGWSFREHTAGMYGQMQPKGKVRAISPSALYSEFHSIKIQLSSLCITPLELSKHRRSTALSSRVRLPSGGPPCVAVTGSSASQKWKLQGELKLIKRH